MTADRLLIAALLAGASYPLSWLLTLPEGLAMTWKGAGVGLLALWAWRRAREPDGRLLAAVLALGAAGDIVLERAFVAGAALFALGHIVAIVLYLRNRRARTAGSQRLLATVLIVAVPAIGWSLPADRTMATAVAAYALLLGAMAATAWISRFSRYRAGIGALLFVASDLLIFARMGPLATTAGVNLAIWVGYFAGQALIATGVRRTLDSPD